VSREPSNLVTNERCAWCAVFGIFVVFPRSQGTVDATEDHAVLSECAYGEVLDANAICRNIYSVRHAITAIQNHLISITSANDDAIRRDDDGLPIGAR
jgi:hypothetical protein